MNKVKRLFPVLFVFHLLFYISCIKKAEYRLEVSENGHYLVYSDGTPFYWIGDTGWAMFQKLKREEVDKYLDNRKEKGFTVIQAVLFWYPHGGGEPLGPLNESNVYGFRPFVGETNKPNTAEPLLVQGGTPVDPNDYWDHVDYVIDAATQRGFELVLLPCWGNAYINNRMKNSEVMFSEDQARKYGEFLGDRYKDNKHIIWCLGGDVDPVNFADKDQRFVYRAMGEGIGWGISGNKELKWNVSHKDWDKSLITFHAVTTPDAAINGQEGGSSSIWFHNDEWLDFNMIETFKWMHSIYPLLTDDFNKVPTKPTVLGEGAYELGAYGKDSDSITPQRVRIQGYHTFFAGAAGYTYGNWAIWPFRGKYFDTVWEESLNTPGSIQVGQVMKGFISEIGIFSFRPDQSLIHSENTNSDFRQCAMINEVRTKIIVYFPDRVTATIDFSKLKNQNKLKCFWIDPRNGNKVQGVNPLTNVFLPPGNWEDALLIIGKDED